MRLFVLAFFVAGLAAVPAAAAPEVLFTFDDGPNLTRTPRVLEVLEAHHIKAIFFVNGWRFQGTSRDAERARELLREIVRRGHAIGNHTVHHYFLCGKQGRKLVAEEIEKNAELIEKAIGMRPDLYRTPYGAHCRSLRKTLAEMGIESIGWDIDPQDWRVKSTKRVRDYVIQHLKRLEGRAIVLFHDVHEDTVQALPQVLEWIEQENEARKGRGAAPLQIIDYSFLLPQRSMVPPTLDALGRALLGLPPEMFSAALVWFGWRPMPTS